METQLIKLSKVRVNDKNPRTITEDKLRRLVESILVFPKMLTIRPIVIDDKGVALGGWTGGVDVDSGATNRKLGSDMGRAVTGGGLHGKDLSKADVSVNIMCHKLAQELKREVSAFCAIGDEQVTFHISETDSEMVFSYDTVVGVAREYIKTLGGFERFAEWGLID